MISNFEVLQIILVVAGATFFTRVLPFLIFKKEAQLPNKIIYLGKVLPMVIMLCLIVYCIRNTDFSSSPYGLVELSCIGVVVVLQVWRRNTMLSIGVGTLLYMILIQTIV